ncbi:hypothetical protein D3C72_402180 [compost metagenome]
MIDERIKNLRAGGLRTFLASAVADRLELAVFVLQLEVIPVLATHEHTGVAVLEFKIVNTFEDLREGFTLLEIQTPVITGRGLPGPAIDRADQRLVGIAHAPARTDRQ